MALERLGLEAGAQQVKRIATEGVDAVRPFVGQAKTTLQDLADDVVDQFGNSARAAGQSSGGAKENVFKRLGKAIISIPRRIKEQLQTLVVKLAPDSFVENLVGKLVGGINGIYDDAARQALGAEGFAKYSTLRQEAIEKLKTGPQPELFKEGSEFKALSDQVRKFIDETPSLRKMENRMGGSLSRIIQARPELLEKAEIQQQLANLV